MKSKPFFASTLILAAVVFATPAYGLVLNQVDTFESGTTEGWGAGLAGMGVPPFPPANEPTDGPAGALDGYLLLTALGGGGPGSRLTVINAGQWAGDYLSEGVGAIRMDVNNLGGTDLYLRLLFEDPQGGPPSNLAFSSDALLVPAGSGWMSILFPVAQSDLTAALGSIDAALGNTTALRLYHSEAAVAPAPGGGTAPVVASLGVDNIRALSTAVVPEPASMALMGAGLALWAAGRRRARKPRG